MKRRSFKVITSVLVLIIVSSLFLTSCTNSKLSQEGKNQSEDSTQNTVDQSNIGNNATPTPEPTPVPTATPVPVINQVKAKALYLTGWTVGINSRLQHFIELANTTEINSYVIDIKDDDGYVGYESNVPAVREIGAWQKKYDVKKVITQLHENNIHVIGRLVCFKDPVLSSKKPEYAVKNVNGGLFMSRATDGKMITWLNPYKKEAWPYLVDIAKEAVENGFDEIQFDYVRFPNDGKKADMDFEVADDSERYKTINAFLAYAKEQMPTVPISADVFGIICESPSDTERIGQYLELVGKDIDYISPMAYPSHYALGQIVNKVKFNKPDLDPYGVVYNTLVKAKNRIALTEDYRAGVRPYLQAFTASWIGKGNYMSYGPEQIRQQIKAVYDAGYEQWILWDPNNKYDVTTFAKE